MYSKLPNLVIGFHGCEESICSKVIENKEKMLKSQNSYDWLGHGFYFWENSLQRAVEWATGHGKNPSVIGAIIDLGHCLNLTDYASSEVLKRGYEILKTRCEQTGQPLPKNKVSKKTNEILQRDLDCAVIQQIHDFNAHHAQTGSIPYDSVRGIFIEGGEVYPGAGFREKTHVQLCIVNPNCIKGFFYPVIPNDKYTMP